MHAMHACSAACLSIFASVSSHTQGFASNLRTLEEQLRSGSPADMQPLLIKAKFVGASEIARLASGYYDAPDLHGVAALRCALTATRRQLEADGWL